MKCVRSAIELICFFFTEKNKKRTIHTKRKVRFVWIILGGKGNSKHTVADPQAISYKMIRKSNDRLQSTRSVRTPDIGLNPEIPSD